MKRLSAWHNIRLQNRAKECKQKAVKNYNKKKFEKALTYYLELCGLLPNDFRFPMKVGEIYEKINQPDKAIEFFKKTAANYGEKGFSVQAIAVCKRILTLDPKEVETKNLLSLLYSKRGYSDELPTSRSVETPSNSGSPKLPAPNTGLSATPGSAKTFISSSSLHPQGLIEYVNSKGIELEKLPKIMLFSELAKDEFESLIDRLTLRCLEPQTLVCKEGELSDSMFIIANGRIQIYTENSPGKPKILAILKPGDFFGEIGMFTHSPRTASCITISETELLEIKRSDFQWMVKQYDRVRDVLSRFYKARVLDTILIKSEIFCLLAPEVRQQLIDRLIPEEFKNGDTIIEEGTSGDCLYIIREGSVEVTAKKQGKQVHLANLRSGDFFGEVALLKLTKRTATVRAKENCDILRLDPESFYWITKQYPQIEKTLKTLAQKRTEQTLRAVA